MSNTKLREYSPDEWIVEPGNVSIIHCITSINLANVSRNKCDNSVKGLLINKTGLTGDIVFTPGFNCSISERNNIFTIEGVNGGGACLEEPYCGASRVPMTEEEEQSLEEGPLDGCIQCNETIKAINGVNDSNINIQGGPGVSVTHKDNVITLTLETQHFANGCNI